MGNYDVSLESSPSWCLKILVSFVDFQRVQAHEFGVKVWHPKMRPSLLEHRTQIETHAALVSKDYSLSADIYFEKGFCRHDSDTPIGSG